jgi:hypothetical protein
LVFFLVFFFLLFLVFIIVFDIHHPENVLVLHACTESVVCNFKFVSVVTSDIPGRPLLVEETEK